MLGAVLGGLWPFALFTLVSTGSFLWRAIALGVGQLFLSMMYGPQAAFLSELFSTDVRYSGTSLSYGPFWYFESPNVHIRISRN